MAWIGAAGIGGVLLYFLRNIPNAKFENKSEPRTNNVKKS
jgi:hypothetical protein